MPGGSSCGHTEIPLNPIRAFNRDRLIMADQGRVARLCVLLFDRIQQHPNYEEQLLALAGAFILMAQALKVEPQEAFTAVKNLMVDPNHSDGLVSQFAAMRYHLDTELLKERR